MRKEKILKTLLQRISHDKTRMCTYGILIISFPTVWEADSRPRTVNRAHVGEINLWRWHFQQFQRSIPLFFLLFLQSHG